MSANFKKVLWGLGAGTVTIFVSLVLGQTVSYDITQSFENKTIDWRFAYRERLRGETSIIEDIAIVDIDERSLEKYGQFPWPRRYHADLLDYLNGDGAIGVAFDIQFFDTPADTIGDEEFISAVAATPVVINAVALYPEDKDRFRYRMQSDPFAPFIPPEAGFGKLKPVEFDRVDGPSRELAEASTSLGFVNFIPDPDGVTRRLPLALKAADDIFFPLSIAAIHALFASEDDTIYYSDGFIIPAPGIRVPVDDNGFFAINFTGREGRFRYVSYYDVREGRLPAGYFNNKFILVGTSARGLSDLKIVPLSNDFPGVEIHATVMYNILNHQYLKKIPQALMFSLLIIVSLALGVLFYRSGPLSGFIMYLVLSLGYFVFVIILFIDSSTVIELVRPIFAFSFTYILVVVHRYFGEEQEKKKYRGILQHYVAPTVVKQLVDNIDRLTLGGESRELTVLFTDIEDFTSKAEKLEPHQLVNFLNTYTTIQTEAVFEYFGTLDKYIGDGMVVIFGAPEVRREINYAECACRAALKIKENDGVIAGKFEDLGIGSLNTRVGINTGEAVVGNMGSDVRFSYTVLGDSVNLASRLEGLNKEYKTGIIISEMVRIYTSRDFITRELDMVRVKGREKPVRIYELIRCGPMDDFTDRLLRAFSEALASYRRKEFSEAIGKFEKVLEMKPDDGPSKVLIERCRLMSEIAPGVDWDGVWVMKSK